MTTPNALTTHNYIMGATEALRVPHAMYDSYKTTFLPFEPTSDIAVQHALKAEVTVPYQLPKTAEGMPVPRGTRRLKLKLVGAAQSLEDYQSWNGDRTERPQVGTIDFEAGTHTPVLAGLDVAYNTRKILAVEENIWADGENAGLDDGGMVQLVAGRFSRMLAGRKNMSYRTMGETLQGAAVQYGDARTYEHSTLDVTKAAHRVHRATGVPVPQSLQNVLPVNLTIDETIVRDGDSPRIRNTEHTFDDWSSETGRIITTYTTGSFYNIDMTGIPDDEFYLFGDATNRQTGDEYGYGIDVLQSRLRDDEGNIRPTSDAEFRAMVQPFIQSVANLVRYTNKAFGDR